MYDEDGSEKLIAYSWSLVIALVSGLRVTTLVFTRQEEGPGVFVGSLRSPAAHFSLSPVFASH